MDDMEACRQCGGGPVQGGWCRTCGMPAGSAAPPAPARTTPARTTPARTTPAWSTPARSTRAAPAPPAAAPVPAGRAQAMPVLLWAAIGALALAAVLCLVTLIGALTDADALSTDQLEVLASAAGTAAPGFGLVGLVWLGLAAWFVALGSRPARAFTLVGAVFATCALVSGLLVATLAAAALLTLGAAVVLVVSPDARAWFAGPYARPVRGPVSVLLVRTGSLGAAIAWLLAAVALGIVGIVALAGGLITASIGNRSEIGSAIGGVLGVIGGFALVAALATTTFAALQFWVFTALARTPATDRHGRSARPARITATVLACLAGLAALLAWDRWTLLGLAVTAVVVGALWVPDDARAHVGDAPLPVVRRLRDRVRALGTTSRTSSTSVPRAAPTRVAASIETSGAPSGWSDGGWSDTGWSDTGRASLPTSGTACALCGTPAAPGSSFCGTCGARI